MVTEVETVFWVVRYIKDTPVELRQHKYTLPSRHNSYGEALNAMEATPIAHLLEIEERVEYEEVEEDD